MYWSKLAVATDVIQDLIGIDCVAVADADAAIDHVELYCFVVQKIYLHFSKKNGNSIVFQKKHSEAKFSAENKNKIYIYLLP